jgi:Anti-sigma factor NepR
MKKTNPVEKSTLSDAALDPKVLETIGRALKAHYDDLVHAPLPAKLLDLLARLEAEEEQGAKPEE